jgi:hypothetical protein
MLELLIKTIVGLLIFQAVGSATGTNQPLPTQSPNPNLELTISSPDPSATTIPTPKQTKSVYIDPDPIISCTSTAPNCSGQSIKAKQSACTKITCCQVGNKWSVYPSSDQCTKDQNVANNQVTTYPPCVVNYPALGYSTTYSYTTPADCSYWQERAKVSTKPLTLPEIKAAPLPSIEPYKPSQEYTDSYNKNMQEINKEWKPTPFVAPTPKCYATWDEYFSAHPNYAPQNVKGTSVTPPCD